MNHKKMIFHQVEWYEQEMQNLTNLSGTVTAFGCRFKYSLNLSSKACPTVVITSSANPPPHSNTWQARLFRESLATYATKSSVSWWKFRKYKCKTPIHVHGRPVSWKNNVPKNLFQKEYSKYLTCTHRITTRSKGYPWHIVIGNNLKERRPCNKTLHCMCFATFSICWFF